MDIIELRESYLRSLETQIDSAIKNAKEIELIQMGGKVAIKHDLEPSEEKLDGVMRLPNNTEVTVIEEKQEPNEVAVNNSHDYRDLLLITARKIVKANGEKPIEENIMGWVNSLLKHELEHAVPAVGFESIKTNYGVKIFRNRATKQLMPQPFFNFSGDMTVGLYKDIVTNVQSPSVGDVNMSSSMK